MDFKFGRDKKLKSRKQIERLFAEGRRFSKYPVAAVYFFDASRPAGFKAGVSVPKRKIKKAAERNLIKRRIREAVRLNQHRLNPGCGLELMFIYHSDHLSDYRTIEKSVISLIDSLNSVSTDCISV